MRASLSGNVLTMGQAGMISAQGPVIPEIFIWTYLREKITVVLQWNDPWNCSETTMTSICVTAAAGKNWMQVKGSGRHRKTSRIHSVHQYGRHHKK